MFGHISALEILTGKPVISYGPSHARHSIENCDTVEPVQDVVLRGAKARNEASATLGGRVEG